ncbi:MAG: hypothetical protein Q7T26_03530 [Dehalococcoidia bacterium]|nr:hypothetical protein [Dehalococcoidia bacterium]
MIVRMPERFYFALANCTDPAREAEFNAWYDRTLIPTIMAVPGVRAAWRYASAHQRPGEPKYVAMYDIDQDIRQVVLNLRANRERVGREGKWIDCIDIPFTSTFRRIRTDVPAGQQAPAQSGPAMMPHAILLVLSRCTDPAREAEFNQWYNDTHIPDILQAPGILSCFRYENTHRKEGEPDYMALYEFASDDTRTIMRGLNGIMEAKRREGRISGCYERWLNNTFARIYPR